MKTLIVVSLAALAGAVPAGARVPADDLVGPAVVMSFDPAAIHVDRAPGVKRADPPATIGGGTTGPPGVVPCSPPPC